MENAAVEARLRAIFAEALHVPIADIDPDVALVELGADSLILFEVLEPIRREFGLSLTTRHFFRQLPNITSIIGRVAGKGSPAQADAESAEGAPNGIEAYGPSGVEESNDVVPVTPIAHEACNAKENVAGKCTDGGLQALDEPVIRDDSARTRYPTSSVSLHEKKVRKLDEDGSDARTRCDLTDHTSSERSHRNEDLSVKLIADYRTKTHLSRRCNERARRIVADISGRFRVLRGDSILIHPLFTTSARGSKVWDVDENMYLDLHMSYGTQLLGHNARVISDAILEYQLQGTAVGIREEIEYEVAELILSATGMERLAFVDGGSNAIAWAVDLARAAGGREEVVVFSERHLTELRSPATLECLAVGAPETRAATILEFGSERALSYICDNADRIAAVLVEPISAHWSGRNSSDFVRSLRDLADDWNIVLVIDERITGFRCHLGGFQAIYNVDADLAIYGSVIAAGLPIAVVAGRRGLMDCVDGGPWRSNGEGRLSLRGQAAGEPVLQHSLVMCIARALLRELVRSGSALQDDMTSKMDRFATDLNGWLASEQIPIHVQSLSSLFRLSGKVKWPLLYVRLACHGVYVAPDGCCFLSQAHSAEDMKFAAEKMKLCIAGSDSGVTE